MFNLIVKDPYSLPPKRCRLDRGLLLSDQVPSNLLRRLGLAFHRIPQPLWRDFQFYQTFILLSSFRFSFPAARLILAVTQGSKRSAQPSQSRSETSFRAKFLTSTSIQARAIKALRSKLLGLAITCSLWDSLQGLGDDSPDPTNQLATSASHFHHRAGHLATGRLYRSLATYLE